MKENRRILVVCVDRDNDLGQKAGVPGPVIGRNKNLNAAAKLAISDPEDSDVNSIFGAVRKFDEVKKFYNEVEIATLTGHKKVGFESDKIVNEQLDKVMEQFPADGIVLVTDGAEDDQLIPILQSRAPIMSKETIIVKQASEVESTYYTIKEALKDPFLARIVFGVPGIILLLYFALGSMSLQLISLVLGAYLLLKGFGIEEKIVNTSRDVAGSISIMRTSFPFYIGSLFILLFGLVSGYGNFMSSNVNDLLLRSATAAQSTYIFLFLTLISFSVGRSIDAIHFKKAYYLKNYFLTSMGALLVWFILDSGTMVLTYQADLNWFLLSILISFLALLFAYRTSNVFDVRNRITKLLVGLPVYASNGAMLGRVDKVNRKKKCIEYIDQKNKSCVKLVKKNFVLKKGRIIVT